MLKTLSEECDQYIKTMDGLSLVKLLPKNGEGFRKVKVRHKKDDSLLAKSFNLSIHDYSKFINRCVNCYNFPQNNTDPNLEEFYVFPINDYKIIFNKEIKNSKTELGNTLKILESQISQDVCVKTLAEMIKLTYSTPSIQDFTDSQCEFLIYNIDYFYAIRKSLIKNYEDMFKKNYAIDI
jgi:hypothetical protein